MNRDRGGGREKEREREAEIESPISWLVDKIVCPYSGSPVGLVDCSAALCGSFAFHLSLAFLSENNDLSGQIGWLGSGSSKT